jgi:hypothetical protein
MISVTVLFRKFSLYYMCSVSKHFPFFRCASAANVDFTHVDVPGTKNIPLNYIL